MKRWAQLTNHQLAVLQRVGDPDDQVTARESELARTIYALRDRRLVITPRFDGKWRAEITDAGRFYLEHGQHPDRPGPQNQAAPSVSTAGNRPAKPKSASSQEAEAKKLILLLQQQDGHLRIGDPDELTRAAWRRTIHAAKQYGLVPEGMHLLHHGRDHGELLIELVEGEHPDTKYRASRPRLDAPRPRSTHPLIMQLRRHPGRLAVSSGSRERALEILGVLVAEWAHRGHQVALEDDATGVTFIEGKSRFVLEMSEEYDVVEAPLSVGAHGKGPGSAHVMGPGPDVGESAAGAADRPARPSAALLKYGCHDRQCRASWLARSLGSAVGRRNVRRPHDEHRERLAGP